MRYGGCLKFVWKALKTAWQVHTVSAGADQLLKLNLLSTYWLNTWSSQLRPAQWTRIFSQQLYEIETDSRSFPLPGQ